MARSPYGIRADFHVLDGSGMIEMAGADDSTGYRSKGDGLLSGDGPQLSLSSQASSSKGTYCAARAKGSQCTDSARPASKIVPEIPGVQRLHPQCLEELV